MDLSDSDGEEARETEEGEISRDSNEIFLLSSVESKTIKTGYVALVAEIQVWYFLMLSRTVLDRTILGYIAQIKSVISTYLPFVFEHRRCSYPERLQGVAIKREHPYIM